MKQFILMLVLSVYSAQAAAVVVECNSSEYKIIITSTSPADLRVTFKGETVEADGFVDGNEIDLVARFKSIGEMTLFAKIGQTSEVNYAFIKGKRISVVCR